MNSEEQAQVDVTTERRDMVQWHAHIRVEKRRGDWRADEIDAGLAPDPFEVLEREGNLLMYGGASALWDLLIAGGTVTAFNNANAYIGVGDSNTAAAATQTDLQAVTNKVRVAMDGTYPQHTDGTGAASNAQCVWRSTFGSAVANWAWAEWALFNASAAGRMLNRKVEALGTKASGTTWTMTITLSLA
jgi:hypothetical protein